MPISNTRTTGVFSSDVRVDGTYIFDKDRSSGRSVFFTPGALIRYTRIGGNFELEFTVPHDLGTKVTIPANQSVVPLYAPTIIVFEGQSILWAAVKSGFNFVPRRPHPANPGVYLIMESTRGGVDRFFTGPHARRGFAADGWHMYTRLTDDAPSPASGINIGATAADTGLSVRFGFPTVPISAISTPDIRGLERKYSISSTVGGGEMLKWNTGTSLSARITDIMRYLLGRTSTSYRNGAITVSPSRWTGALSDYVTQNITIRRGVGGTYDTDQKNQTVSIPGSNPVVEFVAYNAFSRLAGITGRVTVRDHVASFRNNAFQVLHDNINVQAVAEGAPFVHETLSVYMDHNPLYDDMAITPDKTEIPARPPATGRIFLKKDNTDTAAEPIPISKDVARSGYQQRWFSVVAREGTGVRSFSGSIAFSPEPVDSDIWYIPGGNPAGRTSRITASELGEAEIVVSSTSVSVAPTVTEAKVDIRLNEPPGSTITVRVTADSSEAELGWSHSPSSFTFTVTGDESYDKPQTLTVTTVPITDELPKTVEYTFTASGSSEYNGKTAGASFTKGFAFRGSVPIQGPTTPLLFGSGAPRVSSREISGGAAKGKYYIEELELDLIADTVTVTARENDYEDADLEEYLK